MTNYKSLQHTKWEKKKRKGTSHFSDFLGPPFAKGRSDCGLSHTSRLGRPVRFCTVVFPETGRFGGDPNSVGFAEIDWFRPLPAA